MSNPDTPTPEPRPSKEVELHRERGLLAAAGPESLTSRELYERAKVLAKSKLVPKALENNPDGIFLVGSMGAELGVSLVQSLSEIHVIEGRPSPSAQLRLSLIRRHGHEARFLETSDEKAVIQGRRAEDARDPNGWVVVSWTIEQARKAGLVDRWVEKRVQDGTWPNGDKKWKIEKFLVGDDRGIFDEARRRELGLPVALPEWAATELEAGKVKTKDNWQKYPADMLRARAASALFRMHFGDVALAAGVDDLTPEERGIDTRLDVDETAELHHDTDDDIVDGEIVDDPRPQDDGPKLSGPARISVELKKKGIGDRDTKLRLVSRIIGRDVDTTKDLSVLEVATVLRTIDYCAAGELEELLLDVETPADRSAVDHVVEPEHQAEEEEPEPETREEFREEFEIDDHLAPIDGEPQAAETLDLEEHTEAPSPGEETESPAPRPSDPPAPPRDDPSGAPSSWSSAAWRTFLSARSVKVTELLKEAQRLAREDDEAVPTTLEALTSCSTSLLEMLVGFVEDLAQQRSGT